MASNCFKCGEEAELDHRAHCLDCGKEHMKMEARLEAKVERLHELIDNLRDEVDCFVGDFNDSLDDDERPQMLKDVVEWEKRLRASGTALTHFKAEWIQR